MQYTDPETGLIYLRARWYDPTTGQFLTVDPLVAQTGQPYSYANGNPINGTDPTGLFGCGDLGPFSGACNTVTGAANTVVGGVSSGVSAAWNGIETGVSAAAGFVVDHRGAFAEGFAAVGCLSGGFDLVGAALCPAATAGGFGVALQQTVTDSCLSTGQKIGGALLDGLATVPGLQAQLFGNPLPLKWLAGIVGGAGIVSGGPIVAHSP